MGIGEALGPIASGILAESYGFRMSNDLLGILMTVFTLLYFCSNGNYRLCVPLAEEEDCSDSDDHYMKYDDYKQRPGPRTVVTLETDVSSTLPTEPNEQLRHMPPLRINGHHRNTSLRLEI